MTGVDPGAETEASDPLARFLDRRYLQVWAVHRVTGERVFLDRGQATDEMRRYTRANLMCPVPGCEVEISARGRSKRDHFFHLNPSGHGEGEGEWHLQAKALLAEWANRQPGYTAQDEESVFVPGSDRIRRADVMATHAEGIKVALEVEYKNYKPEDWQTKQADYDSLCVPCTWVFGHLPLYLRQPRKPHGWPENQTWDRLQWVDLTKAVARAGRPVVFINPVERAVVTAVQQQPSVEDVQRDRGWWRYADKVGIRLAHPNYTTEPVLVLDALDECTLDAVRGLVTPTMVRVEAERAVIAEEAAAAKVREEAWLRREEERRARAAAERAKAEREREERRLYAILRAEEERQAWEQSGLRASLLTYFGGVLPAFLTDELPHDHTGVWAHPAHWHSKLFVDLVFDGTREPKVGRTVSMRQVYGMVKGAGFRLNHANARLRGAAVREFLERLEDRGVIDLELDAAGMVTNVRVRSDGRVQRQRPTPPSPTPIIRVVASPPAHRTEPPRPAPATPPSTPPATADPVTRVNEGFGPGIGWDDSMMKKTVLREFGGIPPVLQGDDRPELAHCIRSVPVHWHAYLYMKYIHRRSYGFTFTLADACRTLVEHHLTEAESLDVQKAVIAYLDRLSTKHRALIPPDPTDPEWRYTVTGALMTNR